ncbi:LOW QUALITY PROTEIN: hypothetical protein EUGRSUZ_E03500 [Eucalyptus grandis]|uniref:Uncharacterized protein n=1 Tax=Eucalyptus grandis TaxID=71139 RepID=A0ACC3LDM8_EUCGR|nr:LOW QUALITY PROTEIN: hypothetical protein EUGRSUZ_E03500 [Eucalyptus grandis]
MNFRGPDTRKGFADYLYTSLVDAGVQEFTCSEMKRSVLIGFDFPSVIAQTKISIVIISENFASSAWCLKELVHILECRRSRGQLVLPIYYKVKPSQLKYLTGRFRGAIDAHKRKMGEMVVNYWIEALREITSVKGWKSEEFGHEGELVRRIHVFKEDHDLRNDEQIGPELLGSIMQSKIAIPIISENYASSQWCLRELVLMLNCMRSGGQKVFPIFYKVEVWQVRNLRGRYGDALNKWKKNLGEKVVEEWKEALRAVCSLRGWKSQNYENGYEGALVKTIVKEMRSELYGTSQLIKELMGIDERVEQITSWIDVKFNDTRIVGIWGNIGVGKTTLARVLYNKLSSHFKHLSFVANIRETSLHRVLNVCKGSSLTIY